MLIGVDWGGTKIEAMAISDSGQPVTRLREMTPRSNYEGCLATIESLVSRVEAGSRSNRHRGHWNSRIGRPADRTSQGCKFDMAKWKAGGS